jgi:hypothetical protein
MRAGLHFLSLIVALCLTATAVLAADISLTDNGDGRFSVNGATMDGVAGIDLSVFYDSTLLAAPVVTQGGLVSGAMMAANTNNPGTIRVAIISTKTFTGSGQIIAINFPGRSGSGGVTSVNAKLIDIKGAPVQARVILPSDTQTVASGGFTSPTESFLQQSPTTIQSQQQVATTRTATGIAATPSIGTLTLPDEGRQPETPKKQEPAVKESVPQEPSQPPSAPGSKAEESRPVEAKAKAEKKSGEIRKVSYSSVVERFKSFTGDRKIAALTELFTRPVADEARQEPAIAVSDGKQIVRVLTGFTAPDDDSAPNFATTEAKVLSLKTEENSGRWLIDLLPANGTMSASVSILLGNRLFEVPVVSIPPTGNLTFSEKEIAAFLKDTAAAKPGFDLNGDGRHDYLDDYIYTGHYLLSRTNPRGQKSP